MSFYLSAAKNYKIKRHSFISIILKDVFERERLRALLLLPSRLKGIAHQRGYGFFGDLGRYITPLAIKAGRYLGKQLFNTGKKVITDVSSGTSLRDSARNRLRETTKKIKDDVFEKLRQRGEGIKRKRQKKTCQSKRKRRKTTRGDIFS